MGAKLTLSSEECEPPVTWSDVERSSCCSHKQKTDTSCVPFPHLQIRTPPSSHRQQLGIPMSTAGISRTSSTASFGDSSGGGGAMRSASARSSSSALAALGLPSTATFGNLDRSTGGTLTPLRGGTDGGASSAAGSVVDFGVESTASTSARNRNKDAPSLTPGPGWGIGMSNSGTYTGQRCPRFIKVPLPEQDAETFSVIKEVIVRKKRARAAKRAAELVDGNLIDKAVDEAKEAATKAKAEREAAEKALREARENMIKVRAHRDAKMKEIDAEFDGDLADRIRKVEREYEKKIQDVMAEEIAVEEVRPEDLDEYRDLFEEKKEEKKEGGEGDDDGDGGADEEGGEAMDIDKSDEKPKEDAKAESEDAALAVPKKKRRLMSEIKTEDLEKARSELDDLNETKAEMVWLLKQVITAENKQKMQLKKAEAAAKKE